ncbi:MAG: Crp/Fnr family transcriptional regulator [Spirochaetes bacterium]|nr:Crp/Fnr family transcriptional regulator [Spirochaetota bacterium]
MYELLKMHPLFSDISAEDIKHILSCMDSRQQHFVKGSYIFIAGSSYPRIGILLSGRAQVIKETFHGDKMIIGTIETGAFFGETYACVGMPEMPVSVEVVEDCKVLLLDVNKMLKTCNDSCSFHHKLIANLLKIVATKNMLLNKKMSYITHKTIHGRLLAYFEDQAEAAASDSFRIPFNRNELADYLCMDRSAMSRELGRMKKEGLLTFNKKTFRLQA